MESTHQRNVFNFKSYAKKQKWKSLNCEEKTKKHGTNMFTTQQFHFLPPTRLAKRGDENIQAQTCLFSSKRRRRAKGNPAYVLDEERDLR